MKRALATGALVLAGLAGYAGQAWMACQHTCTTSAVPTAFVRHEPRAYQLSGHPELGSGAETVTVRMSPGLKDVTVYAVSADGQDETFANARWTGHRGVWAAELTFTRSDEDGTWYVGSTVGDTGGHGFEQRTEPTPAFTVGGAR